MNRLWLVLFEQSTAKVLTGEKMWKFAWVIVGGIIILLTVIHIFYCEDEIRMRMKIKTKKQIDNSSRFSM